MNIPWWGNHNPSTLRILFWYRTISIVGQIATTILAKTLFSFPLDEWGIAYVVVILILVNLYTWVRSNQTTESHSGEIFSLLLIDVAALSALFYFAGGATNPFVSMYLLPLAIGAVLLSQVWVWLLALISMAAYSYLMWVFPNQHAHHSDQSFNLHILGMWVSFVLSAAVIAYFVVRMRLALQKKDELLIAAREQRIKDEKLVSLGALAASTAHEMGTPLGTIQLIISDLEENKISRKEIDILLEQITRCKEALAEMSTSAGGLHVEGEGITNFEEFFTQLIEDWKKKRPDVDPHIDIQGTSKAGIVAGNTVSKALNNLLDNAADASPDYVDITATWANEEAVIMIADKGAGLDEKLVANIGVKPFSTKPDGIGIGAFLAHEIIHRLGGVVKLNNKSSGGLETIITLPLQQVKE